MKVFEDDFIQVYFATLDTKTLPLLFKSMVRPHLEYGNVIWGPHYKGDQEMVEKVQKRATKLISNIWHLPYVQRLKILKLPSLMHRRRRGDMLETYKIITNKANIDKNHFLNSPTPRPGDININWEDWSQRNLQESKAFLRGWCRTGTTYRKTLCN